MTQQELNKALDIVQNRFDTVNALYIAKVARQIKKIGELNASSVHRLVIMAEITSDVNEITQALSIAANLTKQDVATIYYTAMQDTYTDPRFTRAFSGIAVPNAPANPPVSVQPMIPVQKRLEVENFTRAVTRQTEQVIDNLSNTTAISIPYRNAVDRAIVAVSTGLTSYSEATRDAIREIGSSGLQVYYESGYHKRLDTAIRQNILDGTHQIAQHSADMVGEALNYDAIELSAHAHSAPDHEPIQGRIFTKEEYQKMQSNLAYSDIHGKHYPALKRIIGEWHCQHFAMPYSTRFSKPRFTESQLQEFAQANNKGCVIDGKHKTVYEAQQLMRQLETAIRREKDTAVMAQIAGDDTLRRTCQMRINTMVAKYAQIASLSGLTEHRNRMVVQGFKPLKTAKKGK